MTPSPTVAEIVRFKRDLERRLKIDIAQFEKDTGVQVGHIELQRVQRIGIAIEELVDVSIRVELPR